MFSLGVVRASFSRAANHPETSWLQILLLAVGSGSGGQFRGPGPTPAPAARCGLGCLAFMSAYPRVLLRAAPGFLHRGKVPGAARRGAPVREPCSSSCSCHVCCLPSPKRHTRPRPGWLWEALPQGAARARRETVGAVAVGSPPPGERWSGTTSSPSEHGASVVSAGGGTEEQENGEHWEKLSQWGAGKGERGVGRK